MCAQKMVVGAWEGRVVEGAACGIYISTWAFTPPSVGEGGEFQMVMYGFWWVRKEGCRCDGMSERDVRNVLIALGARYVRVRVSSDDTLVVASNSV